MLGVAMKRTIRLLGSPRLALAGMAWLGVGASLSYGNPETTSIWVLVAPLAFLALNLLAAILTHPGINRRKPLLVFHIGLLAMVVLAAVGRLTHFEAHLEMLEGNQFSSDDLIRVKAGIWHSGAIDEVSFVQGSYTVDYSPGMVRGLTHSHVLAPNAKGDLEQRIVGDDRPLVLEGYRFYTSFNKGFAPVLTWSPESGESISGAIHMPSYPLFEYKQDNSWTPPGGEAIKFWLRLDTGLDEDKAWVLDGRNATGVLVVNVEGQRVELTPGQSVKMEAGSLRYDRLITWMGYKVFYDPTLYWMFFASVLSVMGLFVHFWRKFGVQVVPDRVPVAQQGAEMSSTNVRRTL